MEALFQSVFQHFSLLPSSGEGEMKYYLSPEKIDEKDRMISALTIDLERHPNLGFLRSLQQNYGIPPEDFLPLHFTREETAHLLEELRTRFATSRTIHGGAVEELFAGIEKGDVDLTYHIDRDCFKEILHVLSKAVLQKYREKKPDSGFFKYIPLRDQANYIGKIYLHRKTLIGNKEKNQWYSSIFSLGNQLDLKFLLVEPSHDVSVGAIQVDIDTGEVFSGEEDLELALQDLYDRKVRVRDPEGKTNLLSRLLHRIVKGCYEVPNELLDISFRNQNFGNFFHFKHFMQSHYSVKKNGAKRATIFLFHLANILYEHNQLEAHKELISQLVKEVQGMWGNSITFLRFLDLLGKEPFPLLRGTLFFHFIEKSEMPLFSRGQRTASFEEIGFRISGSLVNHFKQVIENWHNNPLVAEVFYADQTGTERELLGCTLSRMINCMKKYAPRSFIEAEEALRGQIDFYSTVITSKKDSMGHAQNALEELLLKRLKEKRNPIEKKAFFEYIVTIFVIKKEIVFSNDFSERILEECRDFDLSDLIERLGREVSEESQFWHISLHMQREDSVRILPSLFIQLKPDQRKRVEEKLINLFSHKGVLRGFEPEFFKEFYEFFMLCRGEGQQFLTSVLSDAIVEHNGTSLFTSRQLERLCSIIKKFQPEKNFVDALFVLYLARFQLDKTVEIALAIFEYFSLSQSTFTEETAEVSLQQVEALILNHYALFLSVRKKKRGGTNHTRELVQFLMHFVQRRKDKFASFLAQVISVQQLRNLPFPTEMRKIIVQMMLQFPSIDQRAAQSVIAWLFEKPQDFFDLEFTRFVLNQGFHVEGHLKKFLEMNIRRASDQGEDVQDLHEQLSRASGERGDLYTELSLQLRQLNGENVHSLIRTYCKNEDERINELFLKHLDHMIAIATEYHEDIDTLCLFCEKLLKDRDRVADACDLFKQIRETVSSDRVFTFYRSIQQRNGNDRFALEGIDYLFQRGGLKDDDLIRIKELIFRNGQNIENYKELFIFAISYFFKTAAADEGVIRCFMQIPNGDYTGIEGLDAICERNKEDFSTYLSLLQKGERLSLLSEKDVFLRVLEVDVEKIPIDKVTHFRVFDLEIRDSLITHAKAIKAKENPNENEIVFFYFILNKLLTQEEIDPFLEEAIAHLPPSIAKSPRCAKFMLAYAEKMQRPIKSITSFFTDYVPTGEGVRAYYDAMWEVITNDVRYADEMPVRVFTRVLNFFLEEGDLHKVIQCISQKKILSPDSIRNYTLRVCSKVSIGQTDGLREQLQGLLPYFADDKYEMQRLRILRIVDVKEYEKKVREFLLPDGDACIDISWSNDAEKERILGFIDVLCDPPLGLKGDISTSFNILYEFFLKYDNGFHISYFGRGAEREPSIKNIVKSKICEIYHLLNLTIQHQEEVEKYAYIIELLSYIDEAKNTSALETLYWSAKRKRMLFNQSFFFSFVDLVNDGNLPERIYVELIDQCDSFFDDSSPIEKSQSKEQVIDPYTTKKTVVNKVVLLFSNISPEHTKNPRFHFAVFNKIYNYSNSGFYKAEYEDFAEIFFKWMKNKEDAQKWLAERVIDFVKMNLSHLMLISLIVQRIGHVFSGNRIDFFCYIITVVRVLIIRFRDERKELPFLMRASILEGIHKEWNFLVQNIDKTDSRTEPREFIADAFNGMFASAIEKFHQMRQRDDELNPDRFLKEEAKDAFVNGLEEWGEEPWGDDLDRELCLVYHSLLCLPCYADLDLSSEKAGFLSKVSQSTLLFDPNIFSYFVEIEHSFSDQWNATLIRVFERVIFRVANFNQAMSLTKYIEWFRYCIDLIDRRMEPCNQEMIAHLIRKYNGLLDAHFSDPKDSSILSSVPSMVAIGEWLKKKSQDFTSPVSSSIVRLNTACQKAHAQL